ncbi:MAG: putative Ig domain-containing protein, partial [Rhodanobacter sp.]
MVAVVAGNGLGLDNTSLPQWGPGRGGAIGQGGVGQYFNAVTGNLALQNADEGLIFDGLPLAVLRTYNSQGQLTGSQGWLFGFSRSIGGLTGTLGTVGSTVVRTGDDGSRVTYVYDATRGLYVSSGQRGAEDLLRWDGATSCWTWTDSADSQQETYDAGGLLTGLSDPRTGAHYRFSYGDGRLGQIVADDGDTLIFGYDGAGQLTSLSVQEVPPGQGAAVTRQQVGYAYDAQGRLSTVTTTLASDTHADGAVYVTSYAYDGSSDRIASVSQSDGTVAGYTYAADANGSYRVATITTGMGAAAQTLTLGYDLAADTTTITDALGQAWTYTYNAAGQLTQVTAPTVDGSSPTTRYSYDGNGNLLTATDADGGVTRYRYDDRGNRLSVEDATGHTVSYTYNADDQVLSQTVYTVPAQGVAGESGYVAPGGAQTTYYVYDADDRLSYVIDPQGHVTEHGYTTGNGLTVLANTLQYAGASYSLAGLGPDTPPSLADLQGWVGSAPVQAVLGRALRTDYTYDARGQLATRTQWDTLDGSGHGDLAGDAGASVTRYTYDAQGRLLQTSAVRGTDRTTLETASYAYDGLDRLVSATDALGHVTSYVYTDSNHTLAITQANGLTTTQVRNSAGQLISSTQSASGEASRVTTYLYDAAGQAVATIDPVGQASYTFYDADGRVAGTVDAMGTVTAYTHDAEGRVIGTTQYATAIDTAGWVSGGALTAALPTTLPIPVASADDRTAHTVLDAAGRVVATVDALGQVTAMRYDGEGGIVASTAYATALTPAQLAGLGNPPTWAALQAALTSDAGDRTTYTVYDAGHRVAATIDAGGYVVTRSYDAGGHVVQTRGYATALTAAQRAALGDTPTLAALQADLAAGADDQVTRQYYDGEGRLIAQVDAEGYLTTTTYDEAIHNVTVARYGKALTAAQSAALTGQESVATLRADVAGSTIQTQVTLYDAEGRVHQTTAVDGAVTMYGYDSADRLLSTVTTPSGGGQVRSASTTYDAFGDVKTTVDGTSATTIHQYNANGQEILRTDALGNKTWSYYDADGRLTYRVTGQPDGGTLNARGEITAYTYNSFGQVASSRQLAARATLTTGSSSGGTLNPDTAMLANLSAASVALADPAKDALKTYRYTLDGQVASVVDGAGYQVAYQYDTFGDVVRQQQQLSQPGQALSSSNSTITTYSYDSRGERTGEIDDVAGLNRTTGFTYDVFGRVASRTDARGSTTIYTYDRLGRQISQSQGVQGAVRTSVATYDAYDRVLTQTDAMGQVTAYSYSADTHTIRITTPDGVTLTTVTDAYGDTLSVADGAGNVTRYTYDGDGRLLQLTDALNQKVTNEYDGDGHLLLTTDATGRQLAYAYDASGRAITRTVDPNGLNQTTTYTYDGRGQTLSVSDPLGAITTYAYDADGNVLTMVEDAGPGHLNLTISYTRDGAGEELSVTEGAGTADARTVNYVYDHLGRRIRTVVDPGSGHLNLTTAYAYDGNGNLVGVTDPNGNLTRHAFNEANERVFTLDPAGGVFQSWYDADGRVVATRAYTTALSAATLTSLGSNPTVAQVAAVVTQVSIDPVQYTVYDAAGRIHYTMDPRGFVTERRYDDAGRLAETLVYANAVSPQAITNASMWVPLAQGTADPGMASLVSAAGNTDANAHATLNLYDADGQVRFVVQQNTINGQLVGQVSERRYDAAGRVSSDVVYGTTIPLGTTSSLTAQLSTASVTQTLAGSTNQHQSRYVYDAAGNLRYTIDAGNHVTEQQYNASGQVTKSLTYLNTVTIPGSLTEATLASAIDASNTAASTRYVQNVYDLVGRLASVADALGTRSSYTYDATGLELTQTDRDGAVWTYQYDDAGRQTRQISPVVTSATYTSGNTLSTTNASIVTALGYDANGNVTSRTDAYGTAAARTISYAYDTRNHQIKTTYPDAGYVNPANNTYTATSSIGATTAIVTYDALGHAVVSKDVRGNYEYKAYDLDGQLAYEVDANGFVTAYSHDAYGNQTVATRYATALNTSAISGWSAGQALTAAQVQQGITTSGSDRKIATTYDQASQKIRVVLSSIDYAFASGPYAGSESSGSPTTTFSYDAYGNLVQTAILVQGAHGTSGQPDYAPAVWASTYSYYDTLNQKLMDVDPMGYVTTWAYNGAGQATSATEYANAIATGGLTTATRPGLPSAGNANSGYDRITITEYDSIGRKSKLTQSGDYSYVNGTAGIAAGSSVTSFGYDGEDRVTSVTVNGATTTTTYDGLGRIQTVTEPARAVLAANWQSAVAGNVGVDLSTASLYVQGAPVTTLTYDALGHAVRTVRSGTGATAQTTYDHYDALGRLVVEFDANGHPTYSSYDAAGNLVSTWYTLSGNTGSTVVTTTATYDDANQRLGTVTTRAGAGTPDSAEYVKYNAFGEVTARGDGIVNAYSSTGYEISYTYDNAGNLRKATDAGTGALHSYARSLAGDQVDDSWTVTGGSSVRVSWELDLDSRRLYQSQPSESALSGQSSSRLSFAYDRWGNVVSATDARGYVTTCVYDSQNHVIKETEPQVLVVSDTGARAWQAPVKQWFYDVNGRLAGVTDENGHSSWNTYDAAGQLTISQDALGAKTYTAYDALGRAIVQETPPVRTATGTVAHLTYTSYDNLDQATEQGDFLLNSAGTARTRQAQQTYVLNSNGDRLRITDALGNTTYYGYDSQHRVLMGQTAVQHANGDADTIVYDANGNKVAETDANGNTQSWAYDHYGRVRAHTDLSGANYTYTYDASTGLLTRQTSTWAPAGQTNPGYIPGTWVGSGSEVDYTYYANGRVQQKTEKTGSQTSAWTTYQYDASGNAIDVATYTTDGAGQVVHNETVTRYDSHNRLAVVTSQNPDTDAGLMRTAYNYDAVGNRRAVFVQSGFGTNASPINTGTGGPSVSSIANQTAQPGQAWSFNAASAFTDTLGFGLTFTGANLPSWLHLSADGVLGGNPAANGSWSITLTGTDVTGASASVTFTVTVPLVSPAFTGGLTPPTGKIGTALSFTAPSATDANGASVTYAAQYYNGASWVALPSWLGFNAATRTFSGTPPAGSIGSYSLRVLANASNGGSAALGFTFTVASTPPVYQGGLTAHTADATRSFSYTVPASAFYENDQTTLSYSATGLPSWMSFNASTHVFSGTPPTGAIGYSNTITVTVTNPQGQSAAGSFTVGVEAYVQPPPVYNGGYTNQTGVIGGSAITIARPTNAFTEPDGGGLTYTAMVLIPQHQLTTLNGDMVIAAAQSSYMATPEALPPGQVITVPAQWVAISQVGLSVNATTGAITGVPTTLDYLVSEVTDTYQRDSTYRLEVIATNGQGGTAAAQFTLTNSFAPPAVQHAIANPSAKNPNTAAFTVVQGNTFSDPYGRGLTCSATMADGTALHSGLAWSGTGLSIGQIASGSYAIKVTAKDGLGRTVSASFTLTVNNVAPVLATPANKSGTTSIAIASFQGPGASDANGDAVTYKATGLPPGIAFNAGTRTFSGTPTTAGTYTVSYTATDSKGASSTKTFTITIVAATLPPVYHGGYSNATGTIGKPLSLPMPTGAFTSPGGQALTYTAKVLIPQHQLTTLNGDMVIAEAQPSYMAAPEALPPGQVITVPAQWVAISQVGLSIGANGTISGTPKTLDYLVNEVTDTYRHDLSYQLEVIATNAYGTATTQFTLTNAAAGTASVATTGASGTDAASPASAYGVEPGDSGPFMPDTGGLPDEAGPAIHSPAGGADTGGTVTPDLLPLPDPDDPPPSGGGGTPTPPPTPNIQSYWFTYDADNRVDIVNGQLSNGHVMLKASASSYELGYDAAGNATVRTTINSAGTVMAQASYYDARNELVRAD